MRSVYKLARYPMIVFLAIIILGIFMSLPGTGHDGEATKTSVMNHRLTVIVDPGHGGEDGGAVSLSGVEESVINIDIATRLDLILGFFGQHVEMTRVSEKIDYSPKSTTIREKKAEDQNRRLKLINSTGNAVLLSIHQNTYPDGGPFGAQVLYAPTNGSKEFAIYMQQLLISTLNKNNRRAASKVPNSILLMNHINCPGLLIECGFLSNVTEEQLLMTDAYRLKIAAVVAAGFLFNRDHLIDINSGGIHEGENNILLH